MADDYTLAARNKIASAKRHLAALDELRAGDESERSAIQDAYEDIISRGFSAGDQLAEAIALKAGLRIRNNSPEKLLKKLAQEPVPARDELESCVQHVSEELEAEQSARGSVACDAHPDAVASRVVRLVVVGLGLDRERVESGGDRFLIAKAGAGGDLVEDLDDVGA